MTEWEEVVFEEFAETWKPELPGEEIAGIVNELKAVNVDGEPRDIAVIELTEEGEGHMTVWLNSVLLNKFKFGGVEVGSKVKIVFNGYVQSQKSKFKFKDYLVYVAK